ncbi:arsenite methyltransferase [Callorhinchus milii]|uniref:Arsenite methyltransferase n=2 Tax=Callorhinchus milii TaxID=7868 RepID=V9KE92_CALMI|nr:arsenite methyltransferase [Callorhinchus milii]|eukprot:gi/632988222/ref/XP_007882989.1/ PREDICTED: arsenite methyltransferase [Callorhinchus milii]
MSADLKTNVCVTPARALPKHVRAALQDVHGEVAMRYYGCGLVVPECLENCWILDLGSGSGRDCYMLSKLVGEKGHVTGVDMTDEQIAVAQKFVQYHTQKFGFSKPNVEFIQGYIEKLDDVGLKSNSYDIIISNCVVNLSPDKLSVLREAYRVLKNGGEMYFSDIYSDRELPEKMRKHKVLWGECLGGALSWEELVRIAKEVGFSTPRLTTAKLFDVNNKELEEVIGDYKFVSATYRLFKIPAHDSKEELQVIYNGSIAGCEGKLEFDANYTFEEGEVMDVDEEMAMILKSSRFADKFTMHPANKVASGEAGGRARQPKDMIIDPFKFTEIKPSGGAPPVAGSCCVTKGCC